MIRIILACFVLAASTPSCDAGFLDRWLARRAARVAERAQERAVRLARWSAACEAAASPPRVRVVATPAPYTTRPAAGSGSSHGSYREEYIGYGSGSSYGGRPSQAVAPKAAPPVQFSPVEFVPVQQEDCPDCHFQSSTVDPAASLACKFDPAVSLACRFAPNESVAFVPTNTGGV